MPIWDIELIPIQIIEFYPEKRVPRRMPEQPNSDRIKDERTALRTQLRFRPFRYSAMELEHSTDRILEHVDRIERAFQAWQNQRGVDQSSSGGTATPEPEGEGMVGTQPTP